MIPRLCSVSFCSFIYIYEIVYLYVQIVLYVWRSFFVQDVDNYLCPFHIFWNAKTMVHKVFYDYVGFYPVAQFVPDFVHAFLVQDFILVAIYQRYPDILRNLI